MSQDWKVYTNFNDDGRGGCVGYTIVVDTISTLQYSSQRWNL